MKRQVMVNRVKEGWETISGPRNVRAARDRARREAAALFGFKVCKN